MVEKILDNFPSAFQDMDSNEKNIVLLAVEHRQPKVYQLLLKRRPLGGRSVFGTVDKEGNSALHLAAFIGHNYPDLGVAHRVQWEIKWYKFVEKSMKPEFFSKYNNKGQTAKEIFKEKYDMLVTEGAAWLNGAATSGSLVAALVATVAFASASTVPGGVNQDTGIPVLWRKPAFEFFAISSLAALCCSVTSLITFLSILFSVYRNMDYENILSMDLLLGLTCLYLSIVIMLVSFWAGQSFIMDERVKFLAFPMYVAMGVPLLRFLLAHFSLYLQLIKDTFMLVPGRRVVIDTF